MTLRIQDMMGHERKPSDFYPTPIAATQGLVNYLQMGKEGDDYKNSLDVLEPACGDGDISMVLEQNGYKVRSSDLRQECYGSGSVDYLTGSNPADWIITNPPFSHAVDFIEKATQESRCCAMLLKSSFWHTKGRLELFRQKPPAFVLALTWRLAFLDFERGKSPFMDVCWVVWVNDEAIWPKDQNTVYDLIEKPTNIPEMPLEYHMARWRRSIEAENGRN